MFSLDFKKCMCMLKNTCPKKRTKIVIKQMVNIKHIYKDWNKCEVFLKNNKPLIVKHKITSQEKQIYCPNKNIPNQTLLFQRHLPNLQRKTIKAKIVYLFFRFNLDLNHFLLSVFACFIIIRFTVNVIKINNNTLLLFCTPR